MKLRNFAATIMIAGAVLALTACKKNSINPASANPQMSFQLKADNASTTLAASPGGNNHLSLNSVSPGVTGLTFTSGIANIAKFKLEAKKNGVETEITSKNLSNVDLFAISPSIVNVNLDTGTYKEIEVRVEFQKTADTSALPLKLKGTFTNSGGTVVPFEFDLNDNVTIKAEAENITVNSTTDFSTLVTMHLNLLLNGISASDIDSAQLTNGTIVVSSSSNSSIYNKIVANLGDCGHAEFGEHHHDGSNDGGHHSGGNN
ncbi:MAG TPA: hypothetical protein VHB54_09855 [Mucilaginibacter sp.]|nr:hypothetical protein [Mucilaginibacter sp.]